MRSISTYGQYRFKQFVEKKRSSTKSRTKKNRSHNTNGMNPNNKHGIKPTLFYIYRLTSRQGRSISEAFALGFLATFACKIWPSNAEILAIAFVIYHIAMVWSNLDSTNSTPQNTSAGSGQHQSS